MMTDTTFNKVKNQFEQFLSLIGDVLEHEKEIHSIQNKLRRHFNAMSASYLCSTDFISSLNHIHSSFNKNDTSIKYFTLLASFDEQMKKYAVKSTGYHQSSNETSNFIHNTESVITTLSKTETTVIISSKSSNTVPLRSSSSSTSNPHDISTLASEQTVEQLLESCNNIFTVFNKSQLPITTTESSITTDSVNTFENRKKKIDKLERRLNNLSKTIRKLEEKDMSLDEMEHCDLYNVESNLKKRAFEVYTKLAELKNQSSSVERILDQPVTLKETDCGHPLINEALETMVNQTKFLPPFHDVVDTVEKTNDKYKLNLSTDALKNLAEKSFKLIGAKVKDRRMADFNDIMNSRLPEDFDIEQNDPAVNSTDFEEALLKNEREACIQTEKILEEFAQIDPQLAPEVDLEVSEESSDEEGKGEEDEDEDEEVKPESSEIIEPSDDKSDKSQYEIVDILPPFSSKSSSPASSAVTETISSEDSLATTDEISPTDRTLTISSTASIPLKRATCDSYTSITEPDIFTVFDSHDTHEPQSIAIIPEHEVQTLIPRHKQLTSANKTLCHLHEQQLTNNGSPVTKKRRSSKDMESSESSKLKEQFEIVILD